MVHYAANFFCVRSSDPVAQSLIKSLGISTENLICLQMPGEFWGAKYRDFLAEFIGLHIVSNEDDKSLHDLVTEEIRRVRAEVNLEDMPQLTWSILNYGDINILLCRRRVFHKVREQWPLVTPNAVITLADVEAAREGILLPTIPPAISPPRPKQPFIEVLWHPLYSDEIAIKGLHYFSEPTDLSALTIDGWGLLKKTEQLMKPRGRRKGSGYFDSDDSFIKALSEILRDQDCSLAESKGLYFLSRNQFWQAKPLTIEECKARTKTLRNWLARCGLTWHRAKDQYCKTRE